MSTSLLIEALKFPLAPSRRKDMLVIFGAILFVSFILGIVNNVVEKLPESFFYGENSNLSVVMPVATVLLILGLLDIALTLCLELLSSGYQFQLTHLLLTRDPETITLPWRQPWKQIGWAMLHSFVLGCILVIPAIASVLTLGFATPYYLAIKAHACKTKTGWSVFTHFSNVMTLAKTNYWALLGRFWVTIGLSFAFIVVGFVIAITIVGILALPFYCAYASVVIVYYLYQPLYDPVDVIETSPW